MMKNQELTEKQAIDIRRKNRNPDVAIGPSFHYRNLKDISYKKAVKFFENRTKSWYFNVAERLCKRKN
ncbi:MAG: hypothetical protein ABIH40_02935 [Candidatus Omnitrophota bacterium]